MAKTAYENEMSKVKKALEEISPTIWGSHSEVELTFSRDFGVFCQKGSSNSIERMFGRNTRYKIFLKLRTYFKTNQSIKLPVPSDAIVVSKLEKYRVIIASAKYKIVLKLCLTPDNDHLINNEIESFEKLKKSEFRPHINEVLSHGMTDNTVRWMAVSFNENYNSLSEISSPETYLFENASKYLCLLKNFYEFNNPKKLSVEDWLQNARYYSLNHPSKEKLLKLLDKVEEQSLNYPGIELIETQLHFDLHKGNILQSKEITFIDWEMSTRGLMLVDMFDFYRRFIYTRAWEKFKFFLFMRGYLKTAPSSLKSFFIRANESLNLKSHQVGTERLMTYIYVAERVILYHKFGEVDRLVKKGFESDLLKKIL